MTRVTTRADDRPSWND